MVEQFVVDGPHAHLYTSDSWVKLMNWQHSTMYLFFGISGIALILSTKFLLVPSGVGRLSLSLALFVEGKLYKFLKSQGLVVRVSFLHKFLTSNMYLSGFLCPTLSHRVSVLLPCAQSAGSGCSHPLPAPGGGVRWISQHHAGSVHKGQHYFRAVWSFHVHPAGLMVLPGD